MSILKSTPEESLFVSDSLSSRVSHWLESSSGEDEDLGNLNPDDCLVQSEDFKIVCPIIGWNFISKTVTVIVPTERLKFFLFGKETHICFFEKEYVAVSTHSVKEDNLWKVTVHFDDKENN